MWASYAGIGSFRGERFRDRSPQLVTYAPWEYSTHEACWWLVRGDVLGGPRLWAAVESFGDDTNTGDSGSTNPDGSTNNNDSGNPPPTDSGGTGPDGGPCVTNTGAITGTVGANGGSLSRLVFAVVGVHEAGERGRPQQLAHEHHHQDLPGHRGTEPASTVRPWHGGLSVLLDRQRLDCIAASRDLHASPPVLHGDILPGYGQPRMRRVGRFLHVGQQQLRPRQPGRTDPELQRVHEPDARAHLRRRRPTTCSTSTRSTTHGRPSSSSPRPTRGTTPSSPG